MGSLNTGTVMRTSAGLSLFLLVSLASAQEDDPVAALAEVIPGETGEDYPNTRLLRRPGSGLPVIPHLCQPRRRRSDQVQLPLSQWDSVQPAVLHLRLVVQCGLLPGRVLLLPQRGDRRRAGSQHS